MIALLFGLFDFIAKLVLAAFRTAVKYLLFAMLLTAFIVASLFTLAYYLLS